MIKRDSRVHNRTGAAALALGAGAALVLAGCSSSSDSAPSSSPTATGPTSTSTGGGSSALPPPPAGSQQLSTSPDGAATYAQYKSTQAPKAVTTAYQASLTAAGYTVTSSGSGGGGWGQYGGSDSGLSANNGSNYVAVNAGGEKGGPTYFEVCSAATPASVKSCQQNNHGNSNQS